MIWGFSLDLKTVFLEACIFHSQKLCFLKKYEKTLKQTERTYRVESEGNCNKYVSSAYKYLYKHQVSSPRVTFLHHFFILTLPINETWNPQAPLNAIRKHQPLNELQCIWLNYMSNLHVVGSNDHPIWCALVFQFLLTASIISAVKAQPHFAGNQLTFPAHLSKEPNSCRPFARMDNFRSYSDNE